MKRPLTENDYIFDGFAHRNFMPNVDSWRNTLPDASDYPCVSNAMDVIGMFEELQSAKRRIWELEQEVSHYRRLR